MYEINANEIGFDFDLLIKMNREPANEQEWVQVSEFVEASFPLSADEKSHGFVSDSCVFNLPEIASYTVNVQDHLSTWTETTLNTPDEVFHFVGNIEGANAIEIGGHEFENKIPTFEEMEAWLSQQNNVS